MRNRARAIAFLPMVLFACGALAQDAAVTVLGAVRSPGTYGLTKGEKLSSLITRAGGFADNAWLRGAVLFRESARAGKGARLQELISTIERKVFMKPGEEGQKREFLGRLSALKPGNRVPVRLAHPRLLKGTEDDLLLEEGDTLHVPSGAENVTVIGAVKMPGAGFPCSTDGNLNGYIRGAGGFTDDADRENAYLLKPDGTAQPLSREWIRWNVKESRWEIPAFREPAPQVEPGDTIVVPGLPVRSGWARAIKDLPRLLSEVHALTGVRVDPP